jgi:hypothetical protein
MKRNTLSIALAAVTLATANRAPGATPGSLLKASGEVAGTVTVTSSGPGGCPTRICTTNLVTFSHCFTNWTWQLVCTTNSAGVPQCTNVPVPIVRCFTNTFPELNCTNEFLSPQSETVTEQLSGELSAIAGCDELFGMFPSNSTFEAVLRLNVRTNDWMGTQNGAFKIVSGTNLLVIGTMTGVTGLGAPVAGGPCAACNHFQGTLFGSVVRAGPLPGVRIQAVYGGDLTGITCPATNTPAGPVTLLINGVASVPCLNPFNCFEGSELETTAPARY